LKQLVGTVFNLKMERGEPSGGDPSLMGPTGGIDDPSLMGPFRGVGGGLQSQMVFSHVLLDFLASC
jgi:hypothetical protein